ncbi:hypothetical protein FHX15_003957 [Rhizobium sp. BK650]|uniref:hypothetical protein n=1 Tax=Rhizobium sp. BK650 TaxID=2586990 RepID=UPI0017C99899|nr:hypothetical protein [Rhizobium sp. BK650]MBB3658697.1 hypothetical protein [Rhizobium sp. BK650]
MVSHRRSKLIADVVIDKNGCRHRFVGVAARDRGGRLDVMSLKRGEWIVSADLV